MHYPKFDTIAIGVTFSPNLEANIHEAARISVMFGAKLILIHVGEASEEKKTKFQTFLEPFKGENLIVEVLFKPGEPVSSILNAVSEKKIDLLILGALQREKFVDYYMGSIARKITRKHPCSILLLINPSKVRIACKHIVVNGLKDEKTELAIATSFYVGSTLGSEKITIVEEISQQGITAVEDDKTLRKANILKEKKRRIEDSRVKNILAEIPQAFKEGITVKTQSIFGKRGYSIGHYAQVARADLLVMNAPKKLGFFDRLFPHDIEHILSELPTDVLIIQ